MNKDLITLVKHFEGCHLTAYKDPVGIWTIGWGETDGVTRGMKISQEIADAMLLHRLTTFAEQVNYFLNFDLALRFASPPRGPLQEHELGAITSLVYNIGFGAFRRSTLARKLRLGRPTNKEVTAQFIRWNKAGGRVLPGLVRRRKAEAHFFETGEIKLT